MARSQSAWIEFGGHKSTELHAYLTEFPTRPRGPERGEWAEILGKSGALWVPGDAYDLMEIKFFRMTMIMPSRPGWSRGRRSKSWAPPRCCKLR